MLYYTDVTKQVNMEPTEQIVEGLKTCLSLNENLPKPEDGILRVKRAILINQTEEEKKNLQTMIKVFIKHGGASCLQEALHYTITDLELCSIDSVILAYRNEFTNSGSLLEDLLSMWRILEDFVNQGQVCDIGISDVDTEIFIELYNAAKVKPSIHQINLSACCVVPPDLQEFCREHDIRILTHNDPVDILSEKELIPLFKTKNCNNVDNEQKLVSNLKVSWVTRFSAHIRCRGILSNKGYIVCLNVK